MATPSDQTLEFTITIVGDPKSATPVSQYYFGDWRVRVKSSPKAPAVALAFLKSRLDIPAQAAQCFIVRDSQGNTCQCVFDTDIDPGPYADCYRISMTPSVNLWQNPA